MPAKGRERRRTLLGSLLIAGILAVAITIFFLDRIIAAFQNPTPVIALLPDAPGVVPGTPVWIAGERVGRVRRIEFRPATIPSEERVALTLEIPERLRAQLTRESTVRLTSARMIGERVVDIVPGPPGEPLARNDTLSGSPLLEVRDLVDRMRTVRVGFDMLGDDFRELSELPALRDGAMRAVGARFAAVSHEMETLRTAAAGGTLARLLADSTLGVSLASVSARTRDLRTLLGDARSDRTREAAALAEAFREVAAEANVLSRDIARLRARADSAAGTLPRFAADSAISVALRRVQAQLDSLIQEARSNPFRFVF